jgi:hypothetical protein
MVTNYPNATVFAAILASACVATLLGWLGFLLQQHGGLPGFLFPLIFPLLIGLVVGAAATLIGKTLVGPRRRPLLAIACLAGLLAVVGQTAGSYQAYAKSIDTAVAGNSKAAMAQAIMGQEFKPASRLKFVKTQIDRSGGLWLLDAALIVLVSTATSWVITGSTPQSPAVSAKLQ